MRDLEFGALLHDIGHAVSAQKHHKHTYYLVQNADLPGITDREREIVALIARFHRRSPPERSHPLLSALTVTEYLTVRKLSVLLRLADSLDRSHQQPIKDLNIALRRGAMNLQLRTRGPVDLELWDAERETPLFRRIVGRRIHFVPHR